LAIAYALANVLLAAIAYLVGVGLKTLQDEARSRQPEALRTEQNIHERYERMVALSTQTAARLTLRILVVAAVRAAIAGLTLWVIKGAPGRLIGWPGRDLNRSTQ
jgi:hypothetical protein